MYDFNWNSSIIVSSHSVLTSLQKFHQFSLATCSKWKISLFFYIFFCFCLFPSTEVLFYTNTRYCSMWITDFFHRFFFYRPKYLYPFNWLSRCQLYDSRQLIWLINYIANKTEKKSILYIIYMGVECVCVCMILMHLTETYTLMNILIGISIANRQLSSQTKLNHLVWNWVRFLYWVYIMEMERMNLLSLLA